MNLLIGKKWGRMACAEHKITEAVHSMSAFHNGGFVFTRRITTGG